jgi:hypothetical protein
VSVLNVLLTEEEFNQFVLSLAHGMREAAATKGDDAILRGYLRCLNVLNRSYPSAAHLSVLEAGNSEVLDYVRGKVLDSLSGKEGQKT